MSKKNIIIKYAGHRVLLDTIATYWSICLAIEGKRKRYGVSFLQRSGETVEALGNDEVARDKLLEFLDEHFKPIEFKHHVCQACMYKEDKEAGECYKKHDCNDWSNYSGFKREKENDTGNMAASDKL